eukprot:14616-Heterococcus_DN1.PRE.12
MYALGLVIGTLHPEAENSVCRRQQPIVMKRLRILIGEGAVVQQSFTQLVSVQKNLHTFDFRAATKRATFVRVASCAHRKCQMKQQLPGNGFSPGGGVVSHKLAQTVWSCSDTNKSTESRAAAPHQHKHTDSKCLL